MNKFAKPALLLATIIWGSSFFIMKNAVDEIPTPYLLGIRFAVAAFLLSVVFWKKLRLINNEYIWQSAIIGLCLYSAYTLQTLGIVSTTPGKNAFLTTVYCIIVPFLYWIVDKNKPGVRCIVAAFICIIGIGFVSLQEGFTLQIGDFLTLCGGFMYAAHIVAVAKFGKNKDAILLTILQFTFCAVYAGIASLITQPQVTWNMGNGFWISMVYLTVGCTAVALLLQNFGQKYTNPSSASLIMSLESVFGVVFSVIFYHEQLNIKLVCGFVLIFFAIILSEMKIQTRVVEEIQVGNSMQE